MAPPSMLEEVLHRDRVIVVAALLSVVALSWLWVALGAGMDMSAVEMTRMPRDMVMTPAVWTAGYAALDGVDVVCDDGGNDAAERHADAAYFRARQSA